MKLFDSSRNEIYILFGTEGVQTIDEMDESGMENFRTNRYYFPYYDTVADCFIIGKYKNYHLQFIL